MRINSIRLTNYRCHADLKVDFQPGFNVIVGVNGSGKTSLLNGICEAMRGLGRHMPVNDGQSGPLSDPTAVRLEVEVANGRYRFEPRFPVVVQARGFAFGSDCEWEVRLNSRVDSWAAHGNEPAYLWRQKLDEAVKAGDTSGRSVELPVLAYYRAHRRWNQAMPEEIRAAMARSARTDGYWTWWDPSVHADALLQWVVGKCLERFETSFETGVQFDEIRDDELALVNQALMEAVEDAAGLRYDLRQKILAVEWMKPGRDPTAFENLSDGQKAVIGLVADIARRMCLLNPQLGQDVTRKTPGVVLIDELDIHLHPRWQRILTSGLKRAFPSVQFIVASHSPQVLGELQPEEIILLRPEGTGHPQVSYGLTSNQILEEIMDAEARTPEVEKLVNQLFEKLERNQLADARADLRTLKATAPEIPELAGAQALLRRKELLGR